jgi:tRNA pseudouridine38-40 synthase
LNGLLLNQAAEILIGTHDFAAFGTPPRKEQSTIRNLYLANWSVEGDEWKFTIQANAFLYHMVRRLVFFQVAIAQGRLPLSLLGKLLKEPKQKAISGLAPSNGLTLIKVTYPE